MHRNQRNNALQKARRAETVVYALECYLSDVGFGRTEVEQARLILRNITRRLAHEGETEEEP